MPKKRTARAGSGKAKVVKVAHQAQNVDSINGDEPVAVQAGEAVSERVGRLQCKRERLSRAHPMGGNPRVMLPSLKVQVEKVQMSQFLTTSIEDYLEVMRRGGTYADHVVLQAMCNMLTCGMRIVHADVPDIILCSEMPKMMVLGYLPEIQHYVCLKPLIRFVPDEFVAVRLSSRRIKVLYLAKVLQVENWDVDLQYLKTTKTDGIYVWPPTDDTSWQSESDIIERMSTPERLSRRGLQFKFDLRELNLCKAKL